MKNYFITFEGGEGSGKSTQIDFLSDFLKKKGAKVLSTREPGGTPSAEIIRDLVTKGDPNKWTPLTESLLMWASRTEHVEKLIRPSLEDGKWVLCDRFVDSTYVYQGMCGKTSLELIKKIETIIIGKFKPSITFLINLDPEIGLKRSKRPGNKDLRYENMDINFHKKVYRSYLKLASLNKQRIVLIDGSKSITNIENQIWKKIKNKIL